jgi:hypothetical protein
MGRVGSGILIIAIGAILTFALSFDLAGVQIDVIGWILMAAGLAIVVWGIVSQAGADREVREVREGPGGREREARRRERDDAI